MPYAFDPHRLAELRRWATLLDSAFRIPGVNIRFGLDALLGLVPGLGELTTPAFTMLLLASGIRMRVPVVVMLRMVFNAAIDAVIGLVPVIGDLTDIGWKANLRNLELLERHAVPGTTPSRGDKLFVAIGVGLIALVALVTVSAIVLAIWLVAWLVGQRGLI